MYNRSSNVIECLNECWSQLYRQYHQIRQTYFLDILEHSDQPADKKFFPNAYFPEVETTIGGWRDSCISAICGLAAMVKFPDGNFNDEFDVPGPCSIDAVLQIPFINRNPQAVAFVKVYASKFVNDEDKNITDAATEYHRRSGNTSR